MLKILLAVYCILLGCSSQVSAMSVSELNTRARIYLKDTATESNRQRFSDADLLVFYNEAVSDMIDSTWCLTASTTISIVGSTTTSTQEYDLPSNFIKPTGVWLKNKAISEITVRGYLDDKGTDWTVTKSTPTMYYIRNIGSPKIGLYPSPSFSDTDALKIEYIMQAEQLTSGTSIPFNGRTDLYQYHYIIPVYAAYRGWMLNGQLEIANNMLQQYLAFIKRMAENIGKMPNYKPGLTGSRG